MSSRIGGLSVTRALVTGCKLLLFLHCLSPCSDFIFGLVPSSKQLTSCSCAIRSILLRIVRKAFELRHERNAVLRVDPSPNEETSVLSPWNECSDTKVLLSDWCLLFDGELVLLLPHPVIQRMFENALKPSILNTRSRAHPPLMQPDELVKEQRRVTRLQECIEDVTVVVLVLRHHDHRIVAPRLPLLLTKSRIPHQHSMQRFDGSAYGVTHAMLIADVSYLINPAILEVLWLELKEARIAGIVLVEHGEQEVPLLLTNALTTLFREEGEEEVLRLRIRCVLVRVHTPDRWSIVLSSFLQVLFKLLTSPLNRANMPRIRI